MSKILIIVDMQNDFITGSLGTDQAQSILDRVIDKAKNHQGRLIFTKDTHGQDYLETQEGRNLPIPHCIEGTEGWRIQDDLRQIAMDRDSRIFCKETFGSRDLVEYLENLSREEEIEEIEIAGLCTDICVISNALTIKAFLPEVPIKVDPSACGGVTTESHNHALQAMKSCQIEIIE